MSKNNGLLFADLNNYYTLVNGKYISKVQRIDNLNSAELLNATIPYTFWNVRGAGSTSAFQNNIMYVNDGVNPTWKIVLTPNRIYTFTTLATEMQSQLVSITGQNGWTCSYNVLTMSFTIASPGPNFSILNSSSIYNAKLFGFASTDLTGAATYTSTLIPIMQCTKYITMHSDLLSKYIPYCWPTLNSKMNDKLITCINITDHTFGDLINYEPKLKYDFKFNPSRDFIDQIDIYFKDENGYLVDFGSVHPTLTFRLEMFRENYNGKPY